MTERRSGGDGGGGDRPEIGELLSGLDPPRSLPESLRRRLEDGLTAGAGAGVGAGAGAAARPLEPELNERLTAALESREDRDMVMLFSGLDGPRPLPAGTSERLLAELVGEPIARLGWVAVLVRGGARAWIGAGVAAACLLVAAVTGIALTRHNPSRPAATKASSTTAPVIASGSGSSTGGVASSNSAAAGATAGSGGLAAPQAANGVAGSGTSSQASGSRVGSSSGAPGSSPSAYSPSAAPATSSTSAPSRAPQVAAVNPVSGPATGGTSVTIRGLNLVGATSVHFGTAAALNFVVAANGQITAIAPPHLPGFVNITVTTAHGTSAVTNNDRYDYIP